MTNPIRTMINRFQALITTMNNLGDDPVVLNYFVPAIDVMVDDIKDEVWEEVNAFIPIEESVEEEEEEIEEEETEEEDPPAEDPPAEDPPAADPPQE